MKTLKNVFKAFPVRKNRSKSEPPPPPPPEPVRSKKNWNLSPEALAGLLKTLRYLNQYHCHTEGLFARHGSQLEVMTITRMIHNGKLSVNNLQSVDVYSISSAVKNILTLHAPVVPSKMYDRFMSPLANFELLMMGIPPSHQELFNTLMKFLCNILANRQANATIGNLAGTVGILILRDCDEPMTDTDVQNSAELQARAKTFMRMLSEYQEHQKAHDSSASPESTLPLVPPTVYSIQDRSVKISFLNLHSHPKPESEELKEMLSRYGTVNNVGWKDKFAVVLFSDPTEAINCSNDSASLGENFKVKYLGTLTLEQIKQNRADWLRRSQEAAATAAAIQSANASASGAGTAASTPRESASAAAAVDESLVTAPSAFVEELVEERTSPVRTPARMKQISVRSNLTVDSVPAPAGAATTTAATAHVNDDVMEVSSIHSRSVLGRESPLPTQQHQVNQSQHQRSPDRSHHHQSRRVDDDSSLGSYSAIHHDHDDDSQQLGVIDLSLVSHSGLIDGDMAHNAQQQLHHASGGAAANSNKQSRGIPLPRRRDHTHSEDTYIQDGVGGAAVAPMGVGAKFDRLESESRDSHEAVASGSVAGTATAAASIAASGASGVNVESSGGWKSAQLTADALEAHEHSHRRSSPRRDPQGSSNSRRRSHSDSTVSSYNNPQSNSAQYRIADSSSLLLSPTAALSPDVMPSNKLQQQQLFVTTSEDELLPMTPRLSGGSRNNSIRQAAAAAGAATAPAAMGGRDVRFSHESGLNDSVELAEDQQLVVESPRGAAAAGASRVRSVRTIQVIESPKDGSSPNARSFFREDAVVGNTAAGRGGGVLVTDESFDLSAMHSMGSSRGHDSRQQENQQQPRKSGNSRATVTTTVRGSESLVVTELKQRLQQVEALLHSQEQTRDEELLEAQHNEEVWSNELMTSNLRVHQLEAENSELRDANRKLKFELKVSASSLLSLESNKKAMELAVIGAKDRAEKEALSTILAQEKLIAVLERSLSELTVSYQRLHTELTEMTQSKVDAVKETEKWKRLACGGVVTGNTTVTAATATTAAVVVAGGDTITDTSVEGIAMNDEPTTSAVVAITDGAESLNVSELNEVKRQAETEVQSYLSRLPAESVSAYKKSYQEYHSTAVQLLHRGDLQRSSGNTTATTTAAIGEGVYEITTTTSSTSAAPAVVVPANRAASPLRIDVSTPSASVSSAAVKENRQPVNASYTSLQLPTAHANTTTVATAAGIYKPSTAGNNGLPPPPGSSSSPQQHMLLKRQPAFSAAAPPLDVTAAVVSLIPPGQKYSDQVLSRVAEKHTPRSPYDKVKRVGVFPTATTATTEAAASASKGGSYSGKGYLSVLDVYAEMGIDLTAATSRSSRTATATAAASGGKAFGGRTSASVQVQSHYNSHSNRAQNELMNLIQSETKAYGSSSTNVSSSGSSVSRGIGSVGSSGRWRYQTYE